ncbi:MAG: MFS transporter [Chloroflexi bacterium]|nr:MFS transporter [Chloroflexota bacterium]
MMRHAPTLVAEPEARPARGGFKLSTFTSLRYRDYRLLFFSIMFTSAGQWMEQIALSWMAYQMTDSPFMLGAINGMRAIPFLVMGPWAGVAADRMDRKQLMFLSQAYVMLLTGIMSFLILADLVQVWHLFAFTLLSGMGWSFTQPVRQTLIPNLVPRAALMNAVALQSAAFNSTRVIGPTIAGLLLASLGAGWVFALKTSLYVAVLGLLALMRVPATPGDARRASPARELWEGVQYILGNQVVSWLILLALIPMLFAMPFQTLMPVFARDVLQIGPQGFGLLVSASGIGALVGTLTVASLGNFQRKGLLLLLSGGGLGLTLIFFSWSPWVPLSLAVLVVVGGFQMTYMSMTNTLLHLNITDEVRGRVMSIYMLDMGLTPLGALFAGTLASLFSAPLAVTVMGSVCVALTITALTRVPSIRRLA